MRLKINPMILYDFRLLSLLNGDNNSNIAYEKN